MLRQYVLSVQQTLLFLAPPALGFSSPIRYPTTGALCRGSRVLTTGPPGKYLGDFLKGIKRYI